MPPSRRMDPPASSAAWLTGMMSMEYAPMATESALVTSTSRSACNGRGGHLVTLRSEGEQSRH